MVSFGKLTIGVIYLFMKTIERAHMPSKLWEKVKLNRNYEKAIEQIEKHLEFWPNFLVHKCKQRLTKITEYLSKMRKLKLSIQPTLTAKKSKIEKREKKREFKALVASKIENAIEKELLERLKNGVYGDNVYNWSQSTFEKVLDQTGEDDDDEKELDEDDLEFVEDDEAEVKFF